MRITVVGVLVVIGTIVLLALIADRIVQTSKGNKSGDDEQPIKPS